MAVFEVEYLKMGEPSVRHYTTVTGELVKGRLARVGRQRIAKLAVAALGRQGVRAVVTRVTLRS